MVSDDPPQKEPPHKKYYANVNSSLLFYIANINKQ